MFFQNRFRCAPKSQANFDFFVWKWRALVVSERIKTGCSGVELKWDVPSQKPRDYLNSGVQLAPSGHF